MTRSEHSHCSDVYLVADAQAGDPDAFGELYRRYFETVRAVVYTRMRGPDRRNADDVVSEVFTRAWACIDGFVWRGRAFPAWLTQIAINLVRDHYGSAEVTRTAPGKTSAHFERVGDCGDLAESFARAEAAARLRAALGVLTERQRACVVGRFFLGFRIDEIAAREGLTATAVKGCCIGRIVGCARGLGITRTGRDLAFLLAGP